MGKAKGERDDERRRGAASPAPTASATRACVRARGAPGSRRVPEGARGGRSASRRRDRSAPPDDPPRAARAPAAARAKAPPSPEDALHRAMIAATARSRALWARRGLASRAPLDRTTHAMLLRQLYLALFEQRRFQDAAEIAEQALAFDVLRDVLHQDVARARQALGDVDGAIGHLRLAARVSPPSRRAFHWWSLGSVLYVAGRFDEARGALTRAAHWGTTDKPLYQGHLAVVECAAGLRVPDLDELGERLAKVPAGQGYGRFVLGLMAYYGRRWAEARRHLEAFVRRSTAGRAALAIALEGEIAIARRTLEAIAAET
jgi:tetratricopeptide (TPR) repeat protein